MPQTSTFTEGGRLARLILRVLVDVETKIAFQGNADQFIWAFKSRAFSWHLSLIDAVHCASLRLRAHPFLHRTDSGESNHSASL